MSPKGRLSLAISIFCFVCLFGLYFAIAAWMPFMWGVLAPAIIAFLAWVYFERRLLIEFFSLKTTKYGIDMGAIIFLSILFLAVLNFVGARHVKTFDFSINQVNSLSDQSIKIVKAFASGLNVKFFYKDGADRIEENKKMFRDLVKMYQDHNPKIQIEFIEMNEKAKITQDFGAADGRGEAFVEFEGRKNRIENFNEQDFTNALIKVSRSKKKIVYFLEGHGERTVNGEKDQASLAGFKQLLEKNSYETKMLSLISIPEVPEEADVVVIAAPTQGFLEHEVKAIENYLNRGGRLFVLFDSNQIPNGLSEIMNNVGIGLENFYIFNVFNTPVGQVVNAQAPTVATVYSIVSEVTKVFKNDQMTIFRHPHALKDLSRSDKIKVDYIVKSPPSSVALEKLDSQDYTGQPQSYNLVAEVWGKYQADSTQDFSMVVASDIDFMTNSLLYQNLNRDLALNAIAFLAKDLDLISVAPKEISLTKFDLSPPEFDQYFRFIVVGVFLPLPLLFLIISSVLWFRRRHA